MAGYIEIYQIANEDAALRSKVITACQDYAATIFAEASPTATRKQWAADVMANPSKGADIFWAVLISAKASTAAQIKAATDAAILAAVKSQVDKQYGAT